MNELVTQQQETGLSISTGSMLRFTILKNLEIDRINLKFSRKSPITSRIRRFEMKGDKSMQERHLYKCDEQSARSGDIDIEDYTPVFSTWKNEDDGVVDVQQSPFDGTITTLVIKAASEEHAEQLVQEHINEVSCFYRCNVEDARNGDIRIEVYLPDLIESTLRGGIYDADDGVFEERTRVGYQPHFVIVAASKEHAEELMEEHLNEED